MSNSPPFSQDSPRGHSLQPQPSATKTGTPGRLPPLPERSTLHSIRNERASSSAPSLRGSLAARPFPASPEGLDVRPLSAEGSGQNSSRQRVSSESNRDSPGTRVHPLLREAVSQTVRGVDVMMNYSSDRPSAARLAGGSSSQKKQGHESPPIASAPHSRATSPIRLFSWPGFHRTHHEDPFVPVDPFQIRKRLGRLPLHRPDIEQNLPFDPTCEENPFCCIPSVRCKPDDSFFNFLQEARYIILDALPRQIYLHLLLRLPSLYFSRIARVYEDAQLSKPDLERMIESYSNSNELQRQRIVRSSPVLPGAHYHPASTLPFPDEWTTATVSPALIRFKHSWEAFVDSLLREWKTLNLVSALLHSSVSSMFSWRACFHGIHPIQSHRAIISMFQTQAMAEDPVIRTAALLSLTSALMSLSFGCIFIVRFGTMRSMYKATRWAEEAARTTTFMLWNVWILLAMPAVWLAWSMIFFIVAILSYVWRYGSSTDPTSPEPLTPTAALGPRIAVSMLFFCGLLYLCAIVKTLHGYGRTAENRLFGRMVGVQAEDDARGRERRREREHGVSSRTRDEVPARGPAQASREQKLDVVEPGLSAVMGLGLTGLDEYANRGRHGSIEAREEK